MEGRAQAPAAGTVLNALACGKGAAFAIDTYTSATVTLTDSTGVDGEIAEDPDADTGLIERCVELIVDRFAERPYGAIVRTESEIPMAAGLKSSSAAANAVVLATLDALDVEIGSDGSITRVDAARIGVEAARDVGVTVTGAFDDASASMLGGVTVTDNTADALLAHDDVDWTVLVWTPPERAYSAEADVDRCERLAPFAEFIAETALEGHYTHAMTVNGFAFCAALGFSTEPLMEALPKADGVSLSGTGPSVTAIGPESALSSIESTWQRREGTTWMTTTQTDGAQTR